MTWCWEDHRDADGKGFTCTLSDGHDGPHDFTPDTDITVTFKPDGSPEGTTSVRLFDLEAL